MGTPLGRALQCLRDRKGLSRRQVAERSRELWPDEPDRQISHAYVRHLEVGLRKQPNPIKLQVLAQIYDAEYVDLLAAAGYLDTEAAGGVPWPQRLEGLLAREGIRPEYFVTGLQKLSSESFHVVNRIITSLGIQESLGDGGVPGDRTHEEKAKEP